MNAQDSLPLVSVVIVTYQSAGCLADCLQALACSAQADAMELIIVDNASQDDTWAIIASYAARADLPFIRVITERLEANGGYAHANNCGLARATGQTLLLLNPDTVVGATAFSTCFNVLSQFREQAMEAPIGVVGCRLTLASGALDLACKRSFPTLWNSFCHFSGLARAFPHSRLFARYNLTYLDERGSYPVECVCGAWMLVTREAYEATGGLDEDYFLYGEDIDWCYRIAQAGYAIWYEGSASALHLKGGNGGKRSAASLRHFYQTMGVFYRKHYCQRYPRIVLWLVEISLQVLYHLHVAVLRRRARA